MASTTEKGACTCAACMGNVGVVRKTSDSDKLVDVVAVPFRWPALYDLIESGESDVHERSKWGGTTPLCAFVRAASYSSSQGVDVTHLTRAIRAACARGASVNVGDDSGTTPLMFAVQWGDMVHTKMLVEEYHANVNAINSRGVSVLACAVDNGHAHAALYLMERGARADTMNADGYTPLHAAVSKNMPDVIRAILARGVRTTSSPYGDPIFDALGTRETREVLDAFLAYPSTLNWSARDDYGDTPLHAAVREDCGQGTTWRTAAMLEAGASCVILNRDGLTPLARALGHARGDAVADVLRRHGAK